MFIYIIFNSTLLLFLIIFLFINMVLFILSHIYSYIDIDFIYLYILLIYICVFIYSICSWIYIKCSLLIKVLIEKVEIKYIILSIQLLNIPFIIFILLNYNSYGLGIGLILLLLSNILDAVADSEYKNNLKKIIYNLKIKFFKYIKFLICMLLFMGIPVLYLVYKGDYNSIENLCFFYQKYINIIPIILSGLILINFINTPWNFKSLKIFVTLENANLLYIFVFRFILLSICINIPEWFILKMDVGSGGSSQSQGSGSNNAGGNNGGNNPHNRNFFDNILLKDNEGKNIEVRLTDTEKLAKWLEEKHLDKIYSNRSINSTGLVLTQYRADDLNLYDLSMTYAHLHDSKILFHESKQLNSYVIRELKSLKLNVPESKKRLNLEILKSYRDRHGYVGGIQPHHQRLPS